MKRCSKCKTPIEKPGYCTPCRREYQSAWRKENPGYFTPYKKAWLEANKDRALARERYRYALRSGKIVRQPCEVCGCEEVEGHHEDYSKPLEVRWLCKAHHLEAHEQLRALRT